MKEETCYNVAAIGIIILLVFSIFIFYTLFIEEPPHGEHREIMVFKLRDGVNEDSEHGCFFTIRAKQAVDINPTKYYFFVSEDGQSPIALDFGFRDYEDQGEDDLSPVGGDRNKSYRYDEKDWKIENMNVEATGSMWSDGEYIGFDMPKASLGIDIKEGKTYEVMIKDPSMEVVFVGVFKYTKQEF